MQFPVKAIQSITVALLTVFGSYSAASATYPEREVTIKFSAKVGKQPFECGKSYNLGSAGSEVAVSDFRFYVSDVALIDRQGKAVPLKLTQDDRWQYQNVALLDFEDKSGTCSNGTTEMRDRVIGKVPQGNYRGLQFTLGVPFALNHADSAIASSPLNLTSLWWNWLSGYKFLRVDVASGHNTNKSGDATHGSAGFPIHLGSTGCQAAPGSQKPAKCTSPNLTKVMFAQFNPQRHVVIADLKALVSQSELTTNQANTPPGCMSSPSDGDCASIMKNLGLPFAGKSAPRQQFFRFE